MRAMATWCETNARRWISDLSDRIGITGWTALALTPALAAEVDQHGAAVRDILLLGVETAGTVGAIVLLAAYGRGLLDCMHAEGETWSPERDAEWTSASWLSVRLLAVCQLARVHDVRPLTNGAVTLPKL